MFRDEKIADQTKAHAAPMGPVAGQTGMNYPGYPGMSPQGYNPMPGANHGYPGSPYQGLELAQGYFPIQPCGGPQFDLRRALEVGTLYPELYRPYPYPNPR